MRNTIYAKHLLRQAQHIAFTIVNSGFKIYLQAHKNASLSFNTSNITLFIEITIKSTKECEKHNTAP